MSDITLIINEVNAITSTDDEKQLWQLGYALERFFELPDAANHLEVWFRLFERFPEDDGYESFWSILHAIEAQKDYEQLVVESVQRKPTRFPVLMLNRMVNAGQKYVGKVDILRLLEDVATDAKCLKSVCEDASFFL